jgi:hypothetical protein
MRLQLSAITRELPNNVPFSAKVALIHQFTERWSTPVQICFEAVRTKTLAALLELVSVHFGRFAHLQNVVRCVAWSVSYTHTHARFDC